MIWLKKYLFRQFNLFPHPTSNYLFKVSNRYTLCSNLTIKTRKCFYCWVWAGIYLLGWVLIVWQKLKKSEFTWNKNITAWINKIINISCLLSWLLLISELSFIKHKCPNIVAFLSSTNLHAFFYKQLNCLALKLKLAKK